MTSRSGLSCSGARLVERMMVEPGARDHRRGGPRRRHRAPRGRRAGRRGRTGSWGRSGRPRGGSSSGSAWGDPTRRVRALPYSLARLDSGVRGRRPAARGSGRRGPRGAGGSCCAVPSAHCSITPASRRTRKWCVQVDLVTGRSNEPQRRSTSSAASSRAICRRTGSLSACRTAVISSVRDGGVLKGGGSHRHPLYDGSRTSGTMFSYFASPEGPA